METEVLTCPKCSSKDVIKRGLIQTQLRRCSNCGDVKIWDYPNDRKCPFPTNPKKPLHRWKPYKWEWMTEEERNSIDRQIKFDKKNVKHRTPIIISGEKEMKK